MSVHVMKQRLAAVAVSTLMAVCMLAGATRAEVTIAGGNGDMEEGYITSAGDTIPVGYGSNAVKNGTRMRMDFDTKHSGEASMQITGGGDYAWYVFGVDNVSDGPSGTYKFGGYLKSEGFGGWFSIRAYRTCTGGAYCVMNNVEIARTSGTHDWRHFEVDFDMPTEEQCIASTCETREPNANCHFQLQGTGTVWVDSLYLTPPTGTIASKAAGAAVIADAVRVVGRTVHFGEATNYQIAVLGADGRIVSNISGFGREASLATTGLVPGAYVVRITANGGASTHMIAVR
jgi:hypothetical protein